MENEPPYAEDRLSKRGRLMGKLFKPKDRKGPQTTTADSLDAFLHSSPADKLDVTHPPPPLPPPPATSLPKLDTTISRYPQALAVNVQAQHNRPLVLGQAPPKSPGRVPRPNKKGLLVRFVDSYPDIIGEGGDECELATIEISRRKGAKPPAPPPHRRPLPAAAQVAPRVAESRPWTADDDFVPKALGRTPTGYSSIYEPEPESESAAEPVRPPQPAKSHDPGSQDTLMPGRASSARYLETTRRHDENRRSFIEIHQAEMREAEGQALARATRTVSAASQHDWEDGKPPPLGPIEDSPESVRARPVTPDEPVKAPPRDYSPAASITSSASSAYHSAGQPYVVSPESASISSQNDFPPSNSRSVSVKLQDAFVSAGDDALAAFVARTTHLFELFRLHAEAVKPLSTCSPKECARAGLWWFLRGRMGLETAVRERPASSKAEMQNEVDRQQAYSNLAKGYWLTHDVVPEVGQAQGLPPDGEIAEVAQNTVSALKKLATSMQKNGFLPPEEAFLPQTIDKSIWVEYPPMSQDMVALLSGNWASGMTAMQHPMSTLHLLDAFPVADTPENFSYGRVSADVFLMEHGREAQRFYFPCLLSMVRPQGQTGLVFVIASQNGAMQLAIQENKNAGPIWDDVRWRSDTCTLDVRLPRGFMLAVQLAQQDYRMLWSMYEFGRKVKAMLYAQNDELAVFRNTLKAFQYIDSDAQSRLFPKEAVPQCDVAVFEKIYKENGPAGPQSFHVGFRIAAVTGARTRTLSGVQNDFPPSMPVQFGFFRGEGNAPVLSLRFENGRQRGRIVLTFSDETERVKFHSLITGTAISHDEKIVADAPLKGFSMSQSLREPVGMAPFNRMPWKAARIVNEEVGNAADQPGTVLSDKLRIVLEYQHGTVADRVNVAPGELRIRLEVSNAKVIRLLRLPQRDLTMAVAEAQAPKELAKNMADALQLVRHNQTIRSLEFTSLQGLHKFQAALTGYEVLFDGIAATFAIARRRMVVPIHKKWEAGFTRVQVVRHADKQVQLLAFFEDFHHGYCMNFVLRGTDTYESFYRSGKAGIRLVDAKFPLPRVPVDKDGDYDDAGFACLDVPDLPGEHDDISIWFEKEDERDKLCQCLPAPVKGSMRMSSRLK